MMMTSVKKSRTLEVYELTHLGQKMRSSLFRLTRVQNGSVLRDKEKGFYNIMNVVLASTIGVMLEVVSFICLMLYQKMINIMKWLHMLRKMRWQIQKEVRF
jgi:hypothetical protein